MAQGPCGELDRQGAAGTLMRDAASLFGDQYPAQRVEHCSGRSASPTKSARAFLSQSFHDTIADRGTDATPSPDEVSSRLARFELTREPQALWPGLTERSRVAAAREIERITRGMLAGTRGLCIDPAGEFD